MFLLTKRRFKEFKEVLKIIAKRNNREFDDDFKDTEGIILEEDLGKNNPELENEDYNGSVITRKEELATILQTP